MFVKAIRGRNPASPQIFKYKVMPYLAVNEDGQEIICERRMIRFDPKNLDDLKNPCSVKDVFSQCKKWIPFIEEDSLGKGSLFVNEIKLTNGTIFKLTGLDMKWEDEQIEI